MLQGLDGEDSVIGNTSYSPYLLCGNLHQLVFVDSDGATQTIGQKTIINSGTSDTLSF